MFAVAGCIIRDHDLWLVGIAAVICAAGSWATFQLFARARLSTRFEREAWLILTSVVAGAGIWCTHFIAMLGYRADLPISFDPVLTIVSFLLAIVGVAAGFRVAAVGSGPVFSITGGVIIGLAIALMHYTGMQAYRVQGIVSWDRTYIGASIVLSMALGGAALHVACDRDGAARRFYAAGLLTIGIVILHFTGMTAFQVEPMLIDPVVNGDSAALRAMAFAVAGVAAVILGAGFASTYIDTKARADASDALKNMSNGLLMVAPDRTIRLFNHRVAELLNLEPGGITAGMPIDDFLANVGHMAGWDAERLSRVIDNHHAWFSAAETVRVDHHFDSGRVIHVCCQPVGGGSAIITYDDVTEARSSQAEVAHMAFHDALTGLPNRRSFRNDLEVLATERNWVMLMLDLDRFKQVNDTFGHATGDRLLVMVTQRLQDRCEPSEKIFRLGGDEIAILSSRDTENARLLAAEIVSALSRPYDIDGETLCVGCSIGIAASDGEDDTALVQQMADFALYKAKENGRGRVELYETGMLEEAARKRTFEREIEVALLEQQFELHFQPLYVLPGRELAGFEALIRWRHPELGMVSPADFIPVAEQTGAILPIGEWVFDEACRQLAGWPEDIYMSVNVSPVQLRSASILNQICGAIERHNILPRRIEVELTETAMVENSDQIASVLSGLRAFGVRIAMDDFGTGYSSLAHLRTFELDRIKIDRSFIDVSREDVSAAAVVRAVTGLARDLSIATTGEGVENEDQLDGLIAVGCETAQGFLFSKPLSAEKASALLRARLEERNDGDPVSLWPAFSGEVRQNRA
ncbi:EAL domain-containing protein [Pseudohoeflea suaedae]|uniref:EAL domain-containing protein n=1 Tax=Pseudohoeflea suaedae TaxID=877384 RepID=A0A4R5PH23_9HYPH|nr:EAL domain-containing protein [Pseudohoeflea suaedae]TDH34197.1 EAL domain-containing protein [Pseudohoeflea suaedae]